MKKFLVLFSIVLLIGCNKKSEKSQCASESNTKTEKKFEMYQMSEMAALMENMYIENEHLKERIKKEIQLANFQVIFFKFTKPL